MKQVKTIRNMGEPPQNEFLKPVSECRYCGGPLPKGDARRRYCGPECRTKYHGVSLSHGVSVIHLVKEWVADRHKDPVHAGVLLDQITRRVTACNKADRERRASMGKGKESHNERSRR